MAGADRQTPDAVDPPDPLERLAREPWGFDFYGVLRLLECRARRRPRIGAGQRGADDSVRLGQEPTTSFPPSTLAAFRPGAPPRLLVHFLGLLGPNGPLPLHLTEYVRDRLRNEGDATLAHFLDLFNNRMLALFYRAWAGAQPTVCHDRPEDDRFAFYLATLLGLGPPSLGQRDAFPDLAKLHYAGHLADQVRHPGGLVAMVGGYFRLPAALEEFVGHWLVLPESGRSRLGRPGAVLGAGLVVGARVWDRQHKFRLVLGPLGLAELERFLPTGPFLARLLALVRNYLGDQLEWDVNLVLRRDEVPELRLGAGARLGWTTWLGGGTRARDADDLTLRPLDYPRVRRAAREPITTTSGGI
jgi:type VI secretion system protein ImpH